MFSSKTMEIFNPDNVTPYCHMTKFSPDEIERRMIKVLKIKPEVDPSKYSMKLIIREIGYRIVTRMDIYKI